MAASAQGVSLGAPWQSPALDRLLPRHVEGEGGSAEGPQLSRGGERNNSSLLGPEWAVLRSRVIGGCYYTGLLTFVDDGLKTLLL